MFQLDSRGGFVLDSALVWLGHFIWEVQTVYGCNQLTIFCPPGPLPFRNTSVISSSLIGCGRGGIGFACRSWEDVKLRIVIADALLLVTRACRTQEDIALSILLISS